MCLRLQPVCNLSNRRQIKVGICFSSLSFFFCHAVTLKKIDTHYNDHITVAKNDKDNNLIMIDPDVLWSRERRIIFSPKLRLFFIQRGHRVCITRLSPQSNRGCVTVRVERGWIMDAWALLCISYYSILLLLGIITLSFWPVEFPRWQAVDSTSAQTPHFLCSQTAVRPTWNHLYFHRLPRLNNAIRPPTLENMTAKV
ncbi:hypothetical protein ASPWEDRAFT_334202 [Aspergillus wentii DTO 134E9]|uniref:Uncharacterized protein n=1 Tax=Aspergillus wentii DTO 134E9 TaxID=1073089 RepID=A0A1L9RUH5_ASPWE|nr:uncharacterized protein ASPWEDRAFT_334202 [Aspergillus wentii DTO 134E9]OJJ38572.1 hypothetical protein ASPWEDRAFT_334202 [Aspergillus wentii DTO 134E9]